MSLHKAHLRPSNQPPLQIPVPVRAPRSDRHPRHPHHASTIQSDQHGTAVSRNCASGDRVHPSVQDFRVTESIDPSSSLAIQYIRRGDVHVTTESSSSSHKDHPALRRSSRSTLGENSYFYNLPRSVLLRENVLCEPCMYGFIL